MSSCTPSLASLAGELPFARVNWAATCGKMAASMAAQRILRRLGSGFGVAGAGVVTSSMLGMSVESAYAKEPAPTFTMSASKFDQSTYLGRLYTVFDLIDPRTLLTTDAEVKRCQALIDEFLKTSKIPTGQSDGDMWEARKIVEAVIHPVTKEPMFPLGRMSAFVPMNVPICAIMLNASSTPAVIFSQWLNQSYNVMNNYVNRSSLEVDWAGLLKPYAVAVSVSCGIAVGARKAISSFPGLAKFGLFVPYLAVISAGSCNVAFTRMDEWAGRGICIFSPEGKELGMSLKAGQQAVLSTIGTRSVCLPIPVLLVPPVVMSILPVTGATALVTEMVVIIGCMSVALPCALAMLPQTMELSTRNLEPEYQSLKDSAKMPITSVFANKGL